MITKKDILMTDEEVRSAMSYALRDGQFYGDDGNPLPERQVALDEARKLMDVLDSLFAKAWRDIDIGEFHGVRKPVAYSITAGEYDQVKKILEEGYSEQGNMPHPIFIRARE